MSATTAEKQQKIVDACKAAYETHKATCNFFVHAVFLQVTGITLTGNADSLVDQFSNSTGWTEVTRTEAISAVQEGSLVIVGLKGSAHSDNRAHGHVAVVVTGTLYRSIYPKVWCGGSTLGRSDGTKSVGEVWSRSDRDNVKYFKYKNY